jgi:hypothetical protein
MMHNLSLFFVFFPVCIIHTCARTHSHILVFIHWEEGYMFFCPSPSLLQDFSSTNKEGYDTALKPHYCRFMSGNELEHTVYWPCLPRQRILCLDSL